MTAKTYVVTAPGALVKVGDRFRMIHAGGVVPASADADHVALLVQRGIVAEGDPVAGIDSDADAAPPFELPASKSPGRASKSGGS